jgi:hypothetical protein
MRRWAAALLAFGLTGCAIAARSDKFGADVDISIGGIISYLVDVRFRASIGFSKTCKETTDAPSPDGPDLLGLDHFL